MTTASTALQRDLLALQGAPLRWPWLRKRREAFVKDAKNVLAGRGALPDFAAAGAPIEDHHFERLALVLARLDELLIDQLERDEDEKTHQRETTLVLSRLRWKRTAVARWLEAEGLSPALVAIKGTRPASVLHEAERALDHVRALEPSLRRSGEAEARIEDLAAETATLRRLVSEQRVRVAQRADALRREGALLQVGYATLRHLVRWGRAVVGVNLRWRDRFRFQHLFRKPKAARPVSATTQPVSAAALVVSAGTQEVPAAAHEVPAAAQPVARAARRVSQPQRPRNRR